MEVLGILYVTATSKKFTIHTKKNGQAFLYSTPSLLLAVDTFL